MAAQLLIQEGFSNLDPSHPLGGRDGGKDATATKNGRSYVMAVYFPRGQQTFATISQKLLADIDAARSNAPDAIAFVTNQELVLAERKRLQELAAPAHLELFHLERMTTILDAPAMASVRCQFLGICEDASTTNLGGQGGSAPGAGGGGGASIGDGATGGPGGNGGDMVLLQGRSATAPGAGGGGAGAVGKGARAGGGGGGGNILEAVYTADDLAHVERIDFRVGRAGTSDAPGEDTVLSFRDAQGRVVDKVVVRGGDAGVRGSPAPAGRAPTEADLRDGFKVSGVMAAEYIRQRSGLWTIVEAGWEAFTPATVPYRFALPLFIQVEAGNVAPATCLQLRLVVLDPAGFETAEKLEEIVVPNSMVRRLSFASVLELSGSSPGLWTVQVLGGQHILHTFAIEVRLPS